MTMHPLSTTKEKDAVTETAPSVAPADATARSGALAPERRGWPLSNKTTHRAIGVMSVVGLLILWQVFADAGIINSATSSSPSDVWNTARSMISDGTLGSAVAASGKLYGVGFGIAIIIGVLGGIVLGWWRLLGAIFDPWIAILYSTPLIALLPLILVWFGITFKGQVVMVVLVSVFPLLVNVMAGTRQVDPSLLRLAKSFRGSQLAILRTLVLPSLVPYIVTGVRLAAGGGLIGVTVAEYFEGDTGIGGLILREGTELNAGGVFVGIVCLAGAALVLTAIIRGLESRVSAWRDDD
jgi:ABC-type nitrate/sulfonate/bicarbonate transport system permease component